ncbi:MAG: pilus assembly protein PilM [bacterium]
MFRKKQSIGIEITDGQLDLVHLAKTGKNIELIRTLSHPVPSYKTDYQEFKNCINGLTKEFPALTSKQTKVIIGLPRREIFFRHITIPRVEAADIRQVLEFEIERHIPFPAEEVYFDFHIQEQNEESTTLLIVVIRKEILLKMTMALNEAKIKYDAIDISSFSIYGLLHYFHNQVERQTEREDMLTVEAWPKGIEFNLIENGKLLNSREIPNNLSPMADTGLINIEKDDSQEKRQEETEQRLLNMLSSEVTAMVYDTASRALLNNTGTGIFLFGDPQICLRMQTILQNLLGREAVLFDPVRQIGIKVPEDCQTRKIHSSAIGLALQGLVVFPLKFNLIPLDATKKIINIERYTIAVFAALALILGGLHQSNSFKRQNRLYNYIHSERKKSEPIVRKAKAFIGRYQALKEEVKVINETESGQLDVLSILKELTGQFPEDTWLTNLNIDKNELEITGYALVASTLIPIMENSQLFEKVQFTSTITSKEANKERFKIKAIIEGKEILTKRPVKRRGRKGRKKRKHKR